MITQMSSYIYDYVIENANFFNEFDRSSFINNASVALNKASVDLSLSIKGNHYSNILEKTVSHINDIEIDSYAVSEFVTKILGSGRVDSVKLTMRDINKCELITLKPQYLTEAVLDYKEIINGIVSGKYSNDKIRGFYMNTDSYITTLKKRLVSSNIKTDINPKDMVKYDYFDRVDVTTRYLEDTVIPFLQDIPKKKKELITEISAVNSTVNGTLSELNKLMEDITTGISLNKLDEVQKKAVLQFTFNQVRAILEGMSFITYMALRKVHQFEDCVIECQNVYNSLTLVFHDVMTIVESGTFDKKVISATDANNMVERLVDGGNDVFDELAHNIIEYHKGYVSTHIPDNVEVSSGDIEDYFTTLLTNKEYNPDIYNDIIKAYIEIGNGLEIIAKNCDDRFVIFDELLNKSGFMLTLCDRFHNEIEALDDLSVYSITDIDIGNNGEKSKTYYTILAEINNYPKITQQIADVSKEVQIKSEYVASLFDDSRLGDFNYSETINELKIFLESFRDQFKAMNMNIVKGLYLRLKKLAAKADACIDNVYSAYEDNYDSYDDFFKEAVLANLEEIDNNNDMIMEILLKEYYAEREFKERGVRLVYEADTSDNTSVKITDNNANTGGNQTSTAGTSNQTNKGKLDNLLKSVGEWFEKMINSFEEVIGRQKAKNMKWLANNKEVLIGRSYSNVEIQILPYDKLQPSQITQDISKLSTNVSTMSIQNIQNVNSYEDLRSKLINFGPKFSKDEEKVTITNYYKVGNSPVQTVSYANNNIKTLVVNNMIPYCESFYDAYKEEIKKQLGALKTSVENITKTYVTESVNEINDMSLIFTEADAAKPTTDTSNTNTASQEHTGLSNKAGWIKQCVQTYSGSVLNAIRDRNNDYFKVLYALAPKTTNNVNKTTTNQDVNTEQQTEK